MDIVIIFAERWKMTPFEILETDIDKFILLCNYIVNLGAKEKPVKIQNEKEEDAEFWAAL